MLSFAHIGSTANHALKGISAAQCSTGLQGEVFAVFSHCCYVQLSVAQRSVNNLVGDSTAAGCLCFGHPDILPGPINLVLSSDAHWQGFQCQLKKDTVITIVDHTLTLDEIAVDLSCATVGVDVVTCIDPDIAKINLRDSMLAIGELSPADSLTSILFGQSQPLCAAKPASLQRSFNDYIVPRCATLKQTLHQHLSATHSGHRHRNQSLDDLVAAALAVLGAGGGLTPAGDDCVAGVLLGLHYHGFGELARTLTQLLQPSLSSATNTVSAALLLQAGMGKAGQAMLDVFQLLNTSQRSHTRQSAQIARLLDHQGHTSGWDCFAGIWLLTEALIQASLIESFYNKVEYQC